MAHRHEHLGGQHDLVTRDEVLQGLPGDLLAAAGRIHVCRVEEIYPGVERLADDVPAGRLVQRPRPPASAWLAETHAAQRDHGNLKSGLPELRVAQWSPPSYSGPDLL